MKLPKLNTITVSPRAAVPVVLVVVISLSGLEWRSLYEMDHPKPYNVSCIGCHSDKKTLEAMADKAGDRLYLVHSGQVSEAELKHLLNQPGANISKKSNGSY